MVIKEFYGITKNGLNLYKSYSSEQLKIQKVGTDEIYYEAIDIENAPYVYVETTEKIEIDD
jgi:hypothetical protein